MKLVIGWLYPELMSTYGDRGNITVLLKRCEWRDITVTIFPINQQTAPETLRNVDIFFAGGAQDLEQRIVMSDLKKKKGAILHEQIEADIPALFVCGAPQLMGKWYEPGVGERIEGVGIFDMTTKHPGPDKPRLIGNCVAKINSQTLEVTRDTYVIGFENHGGRTTLGKNVKPLATVIIGHGNNGEDHTEGMMYKNAIGTYLHGPLLPKNPVIADWLIQKSLKVKYKKHILLKKLDDTLENQAQQAIANKLGLTL